MVSDELNILLIEDDRSYSKLLERKLVSAGDARFVTRSVHTLTDGIEVLEQNGIDLVLLDLNLPDSEGMKTLSRIHKQFPEVPIIVLTVLSDESIALKALSRGAQDYLIKGEVDSNQIARAIRYAIERQMEINKRKVMEKDLAREKERLAVTLDSIGDGMIATDTEGRVVMINGVAERLTGWPREDAVGRFIKDVFFIVNVDTGEPTENPVNKAIKADKAVGLESGTVLISREREGCKYVSASSSPIRDSDGIIIGVVLVFRDITELKRREEELLKIQKLESIGLLAGGIAHDFNNLLTSIMGNISLSSAPDVSEKKIRERMSEALRACYKARDLSSQLLAFSKAGAPVSKMSVSLERLIRETANFSMSGTTVDCKFIVEENIWPVEVDEGQLSQVISNIIINSVQAMSNDGIITIRIENFDSAKEKGLPLDEGKYVKVAFEDEGIGIPKEYLSKIFDPYFTTKQSGSGLGLATSYAIVKNHGGLLTVESELHAGTKVYMYLPAAGEAAAAAADVKKAIKKGSGRVLIMDDKMEVREAAGEMLNHIGYEVGLARDGNEALKMYKLAKREGRPFDTVIMDLTVPGGMGGKEALERLLDIDPEVKAIVSSGYSSDPILSKYEKYGFKGVLPKPYEMEKLSDVIYGVLMREDSEARTEN